MNNTKISRTASLKRLAWSAVVLCIACCAFIPVLVLLGVSSAIGFGVYFEFAATGFFIASVILFAYAMLKSKRLSCKIDCSCKETGV